jgi:alanyl-tRNA synthetase
VDVAGFEEAMAEQKAKARASWAGSGDAGTEKLWFDLYDELGATDFLGYSTETAEAKITALVRNGSRVADAKEGADVQVIVNQTPFYAESGGQVGDTGVMTTPSGAQIAIADTKKEVGHLWVHYGRVAKGAVKTGDDVVMTVDGERRTAIRANHSVTHLLHEALRRKLGKHVTQKGSLVAPDRFRFDISQPVPIPADVLAEVEADVNRRIRMNEEVKTRLMSPDEAMKEGAMALFGEKYGEEVRVVSMGGADDDKGFYSVELCGGTHVKRTGDIGLLKIVSESALAAGVRRIEGLTGAGALAYFAEQEKNLNAVAEAVKASPVDVASRVTQMMQERRKLEQEVAELRRQVALGGGGSAAAEAPKQINGVNFISRVLADIPAKDLKPMADAFKAQMKSGVVALAASFEGKVSLVVAVTDDLTKKVSAVDLVKAGADVLGGKGGGGRPDMAQAGGTDIAAMPKAIAEIEGALASKAKAA